MMVYLLWNAVYCVLILFARFGDCSSAFYAIFKVCSIIYFVLYAAMLYQCDRKWTFVLSVVDALLVAFFFYSFSSYHDSDFWDVFDILLLLYAAAQSYIPEWCNRQDNRKVARRKQEQERRRQEAAKERDLSIPENVRETIESLKERVFYIKTELPNLEDEALVGEMALEMTDGKPNRTKLLEAMEDIARKRRRDLFQQSRPTPFLRTLDSAYVEVVMNMNRNNEIGDFETGEKIVGFEKRLIGG